MADITNNQIPVFHSPESEPVIAVIPAYNEGIAIGSVVLLTRTFVSEVIVIDDGSLDRTAAIAKQAGARVVSLAVNSGKAKAVLEGLRIARDHNPAAVILLDGDGQHDPSEIPYLLGPILEKRADLVIGSRLMDGGQTTIPMHRRMGQITLNFATRVQSQVLVTDSQSGFRALSRKALDNLDFQSEGYNIESDMIAHFSSRNLTITEVPVTARYEIPHIHKKNAFSHGYDVLSALITEIGYSRPLLLFGILGVICIFIGLSAGFWSISYYGTFNMLPFGPAFAAGVFLMVGLILFTSGLILNYLVIMMKKKGY